MAKAATVQVDPEFILSLDPELLEFYNSCLKWAQKLNNITGGGVSLKFFRRGMLYPIATFCWMGRELARIAYDAEARKTRGKASPIISLGMGMKPLTSRSAWTDVFSPSIKEAISKICGDLRELQARVSGYDSAPDTWDGVSEKADIY